MIIDTRNARLFESFRRHYADVRKKEAERHLGRVEYTIGLIGLGQVGSTLSRDILHLGLRYNSDPLYNLLSIKKLILTKRHCDKDKKESEAIIKDLNTLTTSNHLDTIIDFCDYKDMPIIPKESDIVVICACSPEEKKYEHREEFIEANKPVIQEIAGAFPKDYPGTVIVVTNPTDTMAYLFAAYSGINPRQVVGMNHVDTIRLHKSIKKRLMMHGDVSEINSIDAFVIGEHGEGMVPIRSLSSVNNIQIPGFLELIGNDSEWQEIKDEVIKEGGLIRRAKGSTPMSTATAILEVINAVITETEAVGCSAYFDFHQDPDGIFKDEDFEMLKREGVPNRGIFIGYPVFFNQGKAQPLPKWDVYPYTEREIKRWKEFFRSLDRDEKSAFFLSARNLDGLIAGQNPPPLEKPSLPEEIEPSPRQGLEYLIVVPKKKSRDEKEHLVNVYSSLENAEMAGLGYPKGDTCYFISSSGNEVVICSKHLKQSFERQNTDATLIQKYLLARKGRGIRGERVDHLTIDRKVGAVVSRGKMLYASLSDENDNTGIFAWQEGRGQKIAKNDISRLRLYKTRDNISIGVLCLYDDPLSGELCLLGGSKGEIYLWPESEAGIEKEPHFKNASGTIREIRTAGGLVLAGTAKGVYGWKFNSPASPAFHEKCSSVFDARKKEGEIELAIFRELAGGAYHLSILAFGPCDCMGPKKMREIPIRIFNEEPKFASFAGSNLIIGFQDGIAYTDLKERGMTQAPKLEEADFTGSNGMGVIYDKI